MIFPVEKQKQRLKWAFESCKNGAWGSEPEGESDVVCIRAADFDGQSGRLNDGERTLRAIEPEVFDRIALRLGDLVMEKSGGGEKQLVGRTVLFDDERSSVCSNFLARCRPAEGIDSAYLNYLMLAIYVGRGTYPHIKQSTGIQNLDLGSYLDTRVSIPEISAQQRIARFLDEKTARIDALIARKRALLERLAEKRQALITRAVTKGLNPAAPMKPSGIDWLGEIPAHWEVLPLKRMLCDSTYGVSASLEPTGEVAVLRMGNLVDGEIDFSDLRYLDAVDGGLLLETDDVVFNRTNSLDLVGKASIFRGNVDFPVSIASYLVRFRFTERYVAEFANFVMGTNVLMSLARTLALPSIGQANLNPSRYAAIEFPIPPRAEQVQISMYLTEQIGVISRSGEHIADSLQRLTEYRAALITAAVTGQIAVVN